MRDKLSGLALLCVLTVAACGGASGATAVLDEFENVVATWETQASSTMTIHQMNEMNKANIDFMQKVEEFQQDGEQMTAKEMKRYSDLCTRFAKAMQNMQVR